MDVQDASPDGRSNLPRPFSPFRVMNSPISVVIPVYNEARALELVLWGFCRQSCRDFELFIADDGSGPEVHDLVEAFSSRAPVPVRYTRHADEGFRRSAILNRAVRESVAPYLVFADADCIPHSKFVEAHRTYRAPRSVLCGRRVQLSERLSAQLTREDVLAGRLERLAAVRMLYSLSGGGGHWDEGLVIRNSTLHRWINCKEPYLLGSNFSLDRSLFEEVNGFNEDFVGYGGEDTELEYRLRLAGARFAWVRHRAIQYHLYHVARTGRPANDEILRQTQAMGKAACTNGLRKDL